MNFFLVLQFYFINKPTIITTATRARLNKVNYVLQRTENNEADTLTKVLQAKAGNFHLDTGYHLWLFGLLISVKKFTKRNPNFVFVLLLLLTRGYHTHTHNMRVIRYHHICPAK